MRRAGRFLSAWFVVVSLSAAACGGAPANAPSDPKSVSGSGPQVETVEPAAGAEAVALDTDIRVSFSATMDTDAVEDAFSLAGLRGPVSGRTEWTARSTMVFTPEQALTQGESYTITINTTATDVHGAALAGAFTAEFTTVVDEQAPKVNDISPDAGATGVPVESAVVITFSESMNQQRTADAVAVASSAGLVEGSISWEGRTLTFTPAETLAFDTQYQVNVDTYAEDLVGHALAEPFSASFTTASAPDTQAPTIASTSPADAAREIPASTTVAVTFSEQMARQPTEAAFSLVSASGPVGGESSWSGNTFVFTPANELSYETAYTAKVADSARDRAGNTLGGAYSFEFRTAAQPDQEAPWVMASSPAPDATDVPTDRAISVTFSEPMAKTSTESALRVGNGVDTLAGSLSWSGEKLVFTPEALLAHDTEYTVEVARSAKDQAGNALRERYVAKFLTAPAPSTDAVLKNVCINELLVDPTSSSGDFDTDNSGAAVSSDEFIELYNSGSTSVDISGWQLWDAGRDNWFTFPGQPGDGTSMLAPGAYAIVVVNVANAGELPDVSGDSLVFNADQSSSVFNNSGDDVVLYDPNDDAYIQLTYQGNAADDPNGTYPGFSTTATRVSEAVEAWGYADAGRSLVRWPACSTSVGPHDVLSPSGTFASPQGAP